MIADERQLNHAIEQLARMYRALAALREQVLPHSQAQFALMAEGPLDEIRKLNTISEQTVDAAQLDDRKSITASKLLGRPL
jgi:hypothetical protein